jgi:hypothetical protein
MDNYLRRRLRNWAARTHPPSDGRARLLWAAAVNPPSQREWSLENFFNWLSLDTKNDYNRPGFRNLTPAALLYSIQINFLGFL